MSQEKVEYKKEQKKNRKSLVRKKKIEYVLSIVAVCVIAVGILAWFGYSTYDKITREAETSKEVEYATLDKSALSDYLSNLAQ